MFLVDKLSELLDTLNNGIEGESFDSFIAYPYVKKPTKLSKSVIALCIGSLEAEPVSMLGEGVIGSCTLEANIFSPWEKGNEELPRLAEKTVKAALGLNPIKIAVSPIEADDVLKCYSIKCSFTFNQIIRE